MEKKLVSVATTNQSSIAYLILSHLENEGIKCFLDTIHVEHTCSLININIFNLQWERAKEAINELSTLIPLDSIKLTA
jgi:hypothetical protein